MIIIGKISHPHGILGWVHVISFTEIKKNIFKYFPWKLEKSNLQIHKCDISMYRNYSKNYIIKFKHINDRNKATKISKKNIYIPRSQLPILKYQEYYWHDIFQCYAYSDKKEKIGPVVGILDNSFYNTLEILNEKKKKNINVPFIQPEIIQSIDIKNKIIIINSSYPK
ncbi:ribosome maturation factor RimM [Buchnera aphidicola]|uniref:ribosome maturation factor RimM n=1 Tax=Buchnera aphidicola TaxID=9 RepID=UPI00094C3A5F|nr:ribosome maturation factor RimM [Buchnera aphidicola]